MTLVAAPAWCDSLKRRDHLAIGYLHLDRPGIVRARNIGDKFRSSRISDIEDAPASVPKMRQLEIPASIGLLHRQFKCWPAV